MEIYKCLEVGVANGPLCRREVLLVVVQGEGAIDWLLRVCALAEDEEHLLVDLREC